MGETILLVDDDVKMQTIVADVLRHEGFLMLTATNGQDALAMMERNPVDMVLLDIKLPDIDGIELLRRFVQHYPQVPIVMISGFSTIERAVTTTKLGAYDFLEKPLEPQRVLLTIKNALEKARLEKNQEALVEEMMERYGIIGASESMRKLCLTASRIARLETPILITGENGTGKELLASIIHRLSGRKEIVSMNCAAIPRELIESELFGHRKGSFTGAICDKMGKFQAADGGTLFLDEIGDMLPEMQAKILRALDTKMITPVGGNETFHVNVRFIAATNKNLVEAIGNGSFRMDLYYRLRGIVLHIPPLRERKEAIGSLAQYFLASYCRLHALQEKTLTDSALEILRQQQWLGNVRELKHAVESAAIFSGTPSIDHLQILSVLQMFSEPGDSHPVEASGDGSLHDSTLTYEKRRILEALAETGGNITHAALKLNVDRATLSKKIKRLGLR